MTHPELPHLPGSPLALEGVETALLALSYGVHVIGSRAIDGTKNASLADWLMQVSFKPRLVAVSIENDARTLRFSRETGAFTVNLLHEKDGIDIARNIGAPSFVRKGCNQSGSPAFRIAGDLNGVPGGQEGIGRALPEALAIAAAIEADAPARLRFARVSAPRAAQDHRSRQVLSQRAGEAPGTFLLLATQCAAQPFRGLCVAVGKRGFGTHPQVQPAAADCAIMLTDCQGKGVCRVHVYSLQAPRLMPDRFAGPGIRKRAGVRLGARLSARPIPSTMHLPEGAIPGDLFPCRQ